MYFFFGEIILITEIFLSQEISLNYLRKIEFMHDIFNSIQEYAFYIAVVAAFNNSFLYFDSINL